MIRPKIIDQVPVAEIEQRLRRQSDGDPAAMRSLMVLSLLREVPCFQVELGTLPNGFLWKGRFASN